MEDILEPGENDSSAMGPFNSYGMAGTVEVRQLVIYIHNLN